MTPAKMMKFAREVKAEVSKITWPGIKETRMMTIVVFILVILVAVYLLAIDFVLGFAMSWLLGAK